MFRRLRFPLCCFTLALGACIQRQPGGTNGGDPGGSTSNGPKVVGARGSVLPATGIKAFALQAETPKDNEKVTLTTVPVSGQPFTEALRAEIKKESGHDWAIQLQATTNAPIAEGDVLLATFYVRAEQPLAEQSVVETSFVFELARSPYSKSATVSVQAGKEWRKVNVPFIAKQSYAAGDAHAIFRLGYDPETLEIAAPTVQNYGKGIAMAGLPVSPHWNPPKPPVVDMSVIDGGPLAIDVDAGKTLTVISPYVYGINSQPPDKTGATLRRMGGNRQTGYNWENNASNAGSDYKHQSDAWACTAMGYQNCDEPAAQFLDFAADNKRFGVDTLATVPMVDYVTADKSNTSVAENEKAPSKRWVRSQPHKNGAYSSSPDRNDGVVYEDEFVNYLVSKLGRADKGGIKFYSLDNEPALWPSTHPRIHPDKTTYREMVSRSEAIASQITTIDPSAFVLGGVMFGWSEYQSLSDAPDAKEYNAKYGSYTEYLLASFKGLEDKYHRRLVHGLDIHWYPEARGNKRITDDDNTPRTVEARLQAPRALWDPTYRERSWIDDQLGKAIELVPWFNEKINKWYPGTKLTMTEYDFGGAKHISGGLAQADVLGALGREGVYLATYWGNGPGNGELPSYITAAFKLFRNYDGNRGMFGDTAVAAKPADVVKASVYAALDSKHPGRLTLLVINKNLRARYAGKIAIAGATKYDSVTAFQLDSSGPEIHRLNDKITVTDNHVDYALPPLSATLFVLEKH
ncbi:MAG TPA: glycoside hydrolase family 44 protein [Polyangiaceae bacterium]